MKSIPFILFSLILCSCLNSQSESIESTSSQSFSGLSSLSENSPQSSSSLIDIPISSSNPCGYAYEGLSRSLEISCISSAYQPLSSDYPSSSSKIDSAAISSSSQRDSVPIIENTTPSSSSINCGYQSSGLARVTTTACISSAIQTPDDRIQSEMQLTLQFLMADLDSILGSHYTFQILKRPNPDSVVITEIEYLKPAIISRKYASTAQETLQNPIWNWVENSEDLGIHPEGAKALYLTNYYNQCYIDVLGKVSNPNLFEVQIEYYENRLLKNCEYTLKNCDSNNCTFGIEELRYQILN